MNLRLWRRIFYLLAALLWSAALGLLLAERSQVSGLKNDTCESAAFREQRLIPGLYEEMRERAGDMDAFAELLTASMLVGDFCPKTVSEEKESFLKYKPREFARLKNTYAAVWCDVVSFPIPDRNISFEDSFGEARDYGGERVHEGCDLFGEVKTPGYYPVLSMTGGVVERIGWLPLGGYRIGIRAPHGGYFYYAHLSEYEREFQEGESVEAGEILGYMGDTGYGDPGTGGRFPVHLHLGIYIRTPHHEELAVNPYWVLKANSKNFRNYSY